MQEVEVKLARLRQLMHNEGLDAILLTKKNNFAWLTGGRDCHIETVGEGGAAQLIVTPDQQYVLCNNIEQARLLEEELVDLPFQSMVYNWYENADLLAHAQFASLRWGADVQMAGMSPLGLELARARANLTPEEVERYRLVGVQTGAVLEAVCREIKQGESELEIAARLIGGLMQQGLTPYVTLVAADERIFRYRHPIPTKRKVENYAMVVTCAEKYGLIANATRLVYFGDLPAELHNKLLRAQQVEAALITGTRPGRQIGEIFAEGVQEYEKVGYDDQWKYHHQGGPTGYNPRDYVATSKCIEIVQVNQAFAWNPSITGVKTEDTILVTDTGFEWLTAPGDWPTNRIAYGGSELVRPAILVK